MSGEVAGSANPTNLRPAAQIRRDLDRGVTAAFIAYSDFAFAFIAIVTVWTTSSGAERQVAAWYTVWASVIFLWAHFVVLLFVSGGAATIYEVLARGALRALDDSDGETMRNSRAARILARLRAISPENWRDSGWYALVFAGIVAHSAIVVATGGMDKSPFAQVLIAVFVLGQFRVTTGRAIWGMFVAGLMFAFATHIAYLVLTAAYPKQFPGHTYLARTFIAPGVLVALAATLVYWVSFRKAAAKEATTIHVSRATVADRDEAMSAAGLTKNERQRLVSIARMLDRRSLALMIYHEGEGGTFKEINHWSGQAGSQE